MLTQRVEQLKNYLTKGLRRINIKDKELKFFESIQNLTSLLLANKNIEIFVCETNF